MDPPTKSDDEKQKDLGGDVNVVHKVNFLVQLHSMAILFRSDKVDCPLLLNKMTDLGG